MLFWWGGSLNPRLPRLAHTCNPVDPGVWWRGPTRLPQVPGSQGYSSYMLGTLKIEVYLWPFVLSDFCLEKLWSQFCKQGGWEWGLCGLFVTKLFLSQTKFVFYSPSLITLHYCFSYVPLSWENVIFQGRAEHNEKQLRFFRLVPPSLEVCLNWAGR